MAVGYDISASIAMSKSAAARGQQTTRDLLTGQTGDIIFGGAGGVTKSPFDWKPAAAVAVVLLLGVWLWKKN